MFPEAADSQQGRQKHQTFKALQETGYDVGPEDVKKSERTVSWGSRSADALVRKVLYYKQETGFRPGNTGK